MYLPDYKDGSIVNLVSSIALASGGKTGHSPLKLLPPEELSVSKNIVLIVVDALGYEFIRKYGKGSAIHKHLKGKLTSVMPSTTASAITSYMTGLSPEEHCIVGWHLHLKEIGMIATPLRFRPRTGASSLDKLNPKEIFLIDSLSKKLKRSCYYIIPHNIVDSSYNKSHRGKMKKIGFFGLSGLFAGIEKALKAPGKKFIYAYWDKFDTICHHNGPKGKETLAHFRRLDKAFARFAARLKPGTTIILTSDHGMIDTPLSHKITISSHPKLEECLTLPLSGEPRFTYCYVHPRKARQFESYITRKLGHAFWLRRSEELAKARFFGIKTPGKRLIDRIGDYVLIAKKDYTIRDTLLGEKSKHYLGTHGGVSREEMLIPLVFLRK